MYPEALDCGIMPEQYWELPWGEIIDLMNSFQRRERQSLKEQITMKFMLAKQIGNHIAYVLEPKEENRPPKEWDFWPELFAEEKEQAEQIQRENDLMLYKAKMVDYTLRHNAARTKGR